VPQVAMGLSAAARIWELGKYPWEVIAWKKAFWKVPNIFKFW